jgi:TPR repeat protein
MRTLCYAAALCIPLWLLSVAECDAQPASDEKAAYIDKDFEKELKLAQEGDAKAESYLSAMYRQGRGVAKDPGKALFYLRLAATLGDPGAQFGLGSIYERGDGVPQDNGQAAVWYKKAAQQGDYLARVYLGDFYAEGKGVERDYVQALLVLAPAAEGEGGALARQKFGAICLANDCGAEMNEKAYEYFLINASRTRSNDQKEAASALVRLSRKMSPDQIDHAEARARRWAEDYPLPPPLL